MPRITRISPQQSNPERLNVFIDGHFCCGIRQRTFQAMKLAVGSEISCEELKEKENFFWKQAYGQEAWQKEKVRLERVKAMIEEMDDRLMVRVVGFGADTNQLIARHPDEKGKPDLDVVLKSAPDSVLLKVEVTGTEQRRGAGYWVRPDKLEYAENHPKEDVWIVLHYALPTEEIIFIRPEPHKKYECHRIEIKGAGEIMCVFQEGDPELKTPVAFAAHLRSLSEAI